MGKKNKVDLSSVAKAAHQDNYIITLGNGDEEVEVEVKPCLTIADEISFTRDVVDMVFDDDEGAIEYVPAIRDFAMCYEVVRYFTNIDIPDDADAAHQIFEDTDILTRLLVSPAGSCITKVIEAANEAIEYKKELVLRRSRFDGILDTFGKFAENSIEGLGNLEKLDVSKVLDYVEINNPELADKLKAFVPNLAANT